MALPSLARLLPRPGSGRRSRGAFGQALCLTDCAVLAFTFGRSVLTEFSPHRVPWLGISVAAA